MLSKTFEFLRIADVQPSNEKVRTRIESATAVLKQIGDEESSDVVLVSRKVSSQGSTSRHLHRTLLSSPRLFRLSRIRTLRSRWI